LLLPKHTLVGEQQELPQAVQGLPLVELGIDSPPELVAFQVAEDEDRLDGWNRPIPEILADFRYLFRRDPD
jgi:hypothetical protein